MMIWSDIEKRLSILILLNSEALIINLAQFVYSCKNPRRQGYLSGAGSWGVYIGPIQADGGRNGFCRITRV